MKCIRCNRFTKKTMLGYCKDCLREGMALLKAEDEALRLAAPFWVLVACDGGHATQVNRDDKIMAYHNRENIEKRLDLDRDINFRRYGRRFTMFCAEKHCLNDIRRGVWYPNRQKAQENDLIFLDE